MTRAEARLRARSARRYGHYVRSTTEGYVFCPYCHQRIAFYKLPWQQFTAAVIDPAVIDHLLGCEVAQ